MTRRLCLALIAVIALAAAPPAGAKVRTGPSGNAFYTPPKPMPGKVHGDAVWIRREGEPDALSSAASNRLLLYRSTNVGGRQVAVSGLVHLPKGKPPKGGWPIVTYAHGTTGLGDQCAPSRNPGDGVINLLTVYIEPFLNRLLDAGFAVVRTDYEGLGTKGVHPYLVGRSEGRGVLDIVRAARQAYSSLGRRVVIAGHSQGGHAAVFAAALAPKYTPELQVKGTAALAPAAQLDEIWTGLASSSQPTRLTGYAAIIARGFDAAYPEIGISALLSDRGRELYPLTLSRCIDGITSGDSEFAKHAPRELFREGADFAPITNALAVNDPTDLKLATPLLVPQGTADTTVFPALTENMVKGLRSRGAKVTFRLYEGVDHGGIATAQAPADETFAWIAKRLR